MGWLSAGSASYEVLRRGLMEGISPCVNKNGGRIPRHLYLLPGGVAEVFQSTPGRNAIVFKSRFGLVKLAIESGAELLPCYVFGGTDFFNNLATGDGFLSNLSRKWKMGITFFSGYLGLPFLPFVPRITLCIAEPISIPGGKWKGEGKIPDDHPLIKQIHDEYISSIQKLFDKYKAAAGYPNAILEIL